MAAKIVDTDWMWHPDFVEAQTDTAGLFVHFRKTIVLDSLPTSPALIKISADTRYKLYVNSQLIGFGPVKGDAHLWFYDTIDLSSNLHIGENKIAVHVLRLFHATDKASSFPRLPLGGLTIKSMGSDTFWVNQLESSSSWEAAIDTSVTLPTDQTEDDFLNTYEHHKVASRSLQWTPVKVYEFQASTGLGAPWKLSPRMIPPLRLRSTSFVATHNIRSNVSAGSWAQTLLGGSGDASCALNLHAHTSHYLELEVENHTTGFLRFRFKRPKLGGSILKVTYAECYEDPPRLVPYLRTKDDRGDDTKALFGPQDVYTFAGAKSNSGNGYYSDDEEEETFVPFHWRTFRYLGIQLDVGVEDLELLGIEILKANYPLDVIATLEAGSGVEKEAVNKLWTTSVRTLENCMHDCYEDCPFYEQLQYAMDMRSSALFTYCISGDDRLARQAIIQIHNSFEPRIGLTSSRAPCHQPQIIPHFSLYWICTLNDHLKFFGDIKFLRQFVSVIDGILEFFHSKIDNDFHLVTARIPDCMWNYTDWAEEWKPYGIPPAATRTGFSTYTNCLYAYTLRNAATLLRALGRHAISEEYEVRAHRIIDSIKTHCFDGSFFTDGLAHIAEPERDYSQHNQVWAVLSGAATGPTGQDILRRCLNPLEDKKFTRTSLSMSFYTLRALSAVGGNVYNEHFVGYWEPWRRQLALNLTTWEEDSVSQRSDCHAWGSSPIHEFLVEVAGISPARPGWEGICIRPRLELYREFKAKMPIRRRDGMESDYVNVQWFTESDGNINFNITIDTDGTSEDVVYVTLPYQEPQTFYDAKELKFLIKPDDMQANLSGYESGSS